MFQQSCKVSDTIPILQVRKLEVQGGYINSQWDYNLDPTQS